MDGATLYNLSECQEACRSAVQCPSTIPDTPWRSNSQILWRVDSLHLAVQLAEELAKKLQTGHGAGCAWRGNACDENLLSYPPIPQAQVAAAYHDRLSSISRVSELPKLAPTAVKAIMATHRCAGFTYAQEEALAAWRRFVVAK